MMRMNTHNDRPLGGLFKDLKNQLSDLVRQEVDLAKTEASENVKRLATDASILIAGIVLAAVVGLVLLAALCAGVACALSLVLDWRIAAWLGPLAVGIVLGIVACGLILGGVLRLRRARLAPRKTSQTIREDKVWLQEKVT